MTLLDRPLTYPEVGATAGQLPDGYDHLRAQRVIGHGESMFRRVQGLVPLSIEQIMKKLHVQLVILDDEDLLGHSGPGVCCPEAWPEIDRPTLRTSITRHILKLR